jgi:hypothetical protein
MLRLSTECYVKRAHSQCVYIIVIRKIASVKDDCLETNVRSASSGVDEIDGYEVLRLLSVTIVPVLVRYRVSFSTALVPQV